MINLDNMTDNEKILVEYLRLNILKQKLFEKKRPLEIALYNCEDQLRLYRDSKFIPLHVVEQHPTMMNLQKQIDDIWRQIHDIDDKLNNYRFSENFSEYIETDGLYMKLMKRIVNLEEENEIYKQIINGECKHE